VDVNGRGGAGGKLGELGASVESECTLFAWLLLAAAAAAALLSSCRETFK
jgi:hypothetical protein